MLRALAFLGVLAVGLPVATKAYDTSTPPTFAGLIGHIDYVALRLQVANEAGEEHWFQATSATTVTLNGFAAEFKDLRPGFDAAVQYDSASDVALRIDARAVR